ncbi:hypothetical protein LguiB_024405 [Lonicera macranthoides]
MSSILSCRTARVYPSILINHEGSRRKASWKDPEGRLPGRIQKDESSTSFAEIVGGACAPPRHTVATPLL